LINGSHVCFERVEISAIRRCPGLLVRARVLVVGEVTRPLIDGPDGGIYHGTVILLCGIIAEKWLGWLAYKKRKFYDK
jgi:hypothetical protein